MLEQKAKTILQLMNDTSVQREIYVKYILLANQLNQGNDTLLKYNLETYYRLLSKTVLDFAYANKNSSAYADVLSHNPSLGELFSSRERLNALAVQASKISKMNPPDIVDFEHIQRAISLFSVAIDTEYQDEEGIEVDITQAADTPDIFDDFDDLMDGFFQDEDEKDEDEAGITDTKEAEGQVSGYNDNTGDTEDTRDTEVKELKENESVYSQPDIILSREGQEELKRTSKIEDIADGFTDEAEAPLKDPNMDYPSDIDDTVQAILTRMEAVYRSCFELDRPYGMLYEKGMMTYSIKDRKLELVGGVGEKGLSTFEQLYKVIVKSLGVDLRCCSDLRNVPNVNNIVNNNFNYYPGYMFKYAMGFVADKKYKTWSTFSKALEESIKNRLLKMYEAGVYFERLTAINEAFFSSILVLQYEKGSGIKIRAALPGMRKSFTDLENNIRQISIYANTGISITPVLGNNDVVDIQILLNEAKYLGKPYWAYQAMKVKIDNGEEISLRKGLPMGRKVNGEIVDFKLDPSTRFLTFLAAGSGAGKGVLTLSLVAAALGSGLPVFYIDFKPDMAPIFWDACNQRGIESFTYDAMVKHHKGDESSSYILGETLPDYVKGELGRFAGALLYIRAVQLMCMMAQHRADVGSDRDIMFIFDETQAMQRLIQSTVNKISQIKNAHKPKKNEEGDEVYKYTSRLLDWIIDANTNIDIYVNTTGRKSSTFCIFIAQSPDYSTWSNLVTTVENVKVQLLSRITFADTVCKILGKGSTTSKYGLGGDGKKSVTPKELEYVSNNRFFGIYDGKTTDGAKIDIFKPFLTLNTDDPFDGCWTKGIGTSYGYRTQKEGESDSDYQSVTESYLAKARDAHPGEAPLFANQYGIHTGVGLMGLTKMYCQGDEAKITQSLNGSWQYTLEIFKKLGLDQKYATPTDYMYDFSYEGILTVENMLNFSQYMESISDEQSDYGDGKEVYGTNLVVEDEDELLDFGDTTSTASSTINVGGNATGVIGAGTIGLGSKLGDTLGATPRLAEAASRANGNARLSEKERMMFSQEVTPASQSVHSSILPDDSDYIDDVFVDEEGYNYEEGQGVKPVVESEIDSAQEFTGIYGDSEGYNQRIQLSAEEVQRYARFDTMQPPDPSFKEVGKEIRVNPSSTNIPLELNSNNSVDCNVSKSIFVEKYRERFYKTLWGTKYSLKKRWLILLDSVKKQRDCTLVKRVAINGNNIYLNGLLVSCENLIGGPDDIRLTDIIEFKTLFKTFPNVDQLTIDIETLSVLLLETKDLPEGFFKYSKSLALVEVVVKDNKLQYYRDMELSPEAQGAIAEADMRNKMMALCASKNTKPNSELTGGELGRFSRGVRALSNTGYSKAKRAFTGKRTKVIRGILWGGLAVGTAILGSLTYGLSNMFRKKVA